MSHQLQTSRSWIAAGDRVTTHRVVCGRWDEHADSRQLVACVHWEMLAGHAWRWRHTWRWLSVDAVDICSWMSSCDALTCCWSRTDDALTTTIDGRVVRWLAGSPSGAAASVAAAGDHDDDDGQESSSDDAAAAAVVVQLAWSTRRSRHRHCSCTLFPLRNHWRQLHWISSLYKHRQPHALMIIAASRRSVGGECHFIPCPFLYLPVG